MHLRIKIKIQYLFISLLTWGTGTLFAQGVLIADDASTSPDTSAILELKSTSLGFLPPRLTSDEIDAISSPQAGMFVYNATKRIPTYYNGTDWVDLSGDTVSSVLAIGDYHQGGIIFYLDGMGGGLIAAVADVDDAGDYTVEWGCLWTDISSGNGASSDTDGAANTSAILTDCTTDKIAADLCDEYTNDGYSDWFLPARDQLDSLYVHMDDVGGFSGENYWSSTEVSLWFSKVIDFSSGSESSQWKTVGTRVRPIRSF